MSRSNPRDVLQRVVKRMNDQLEKAQGRQPTDREHRAHEEKAHAIANKYEHQKKQGGT